MEMDLWVSMPKVELHAHLNGSIRDSTLLELARVLGEKGIIAFSDVEHVILKSDRSLTEVFKLFDLIHILTTDHKTVTRITKEKNDSIGMSKRSYMDAVIEGLRAVSAVDVDFAPVSTGARRMVNSAHVRDSCNGTLRKKMYVRLLLSIDRRETTASAMETIKLALEMRDVGVVGIDLSGNPTVGEWKTFFPALKFAREQCLPITLHCGEVPNQDEIHAMLDFLPERIGHACCLEDDAWRKLKTSKIPVEICLTSNLRTNTVPDIDAHHFADLYKAKHPQTLCTDDSGVFSTSLSKEYALAAATFGLERGAMFELARSAVEFVFAGDEVVRELKETFDLAAKELDF
ncbi:hypothetical protein Ancab_004932 [Ancistrocladus abbreviatus]